MRVPTWLRYPHIETEAQRLNLTFNEAFTQYLHYSTSHMKESSVYSIRNVFMNHILPVLGDKNIYEISKTDYYALFDSMMTTVSPHTKKPYSRAFITKARGYLRTFTQWLQERYDVPNTLSSVKLPKQIKSKPTSHNYNIWTEEDFNQFIAVVDDEIYKAFFYTLFYTGCRKGEACAFSDEDYKNGQLHIYKTVTYKALDGSPYKITATKANRNFFVPISQKLTVVLDEYVVWKKENGIPSEFLFGGSRPLPAETIRRKYSEWCEQANVTKIKIQEFRHSYASLLIHKGANSYVVGDLLGDTPQQIMITYGHLYQTDKFDVVNKI